MKNLSFTLVFVFTVLFSGRSFSQDDSWVLAGKTDNYKVYVNKDSIKTFGEFGNNYDVWLKMECTTECNDGYKSISYSVQHWILYCSTKEFNVPQIIDHYTDGDQNVYENATPTAVTENTPGETVFNYFCFKPESPK